MGRFVAAQKIDHRRYDFTSHGKWKCSEVTCESGQGLAKSMGCHTPSRRSDSQELKSHPKKALMVSVTLRRWSLSAFGQEVGLLRVAVVQGGVGVVQHVPCLRAEADGAHEAVEALDRGLRVHHRLPLSS
jgi:hypothetical protein